MRRALLAFLLALSFIFIGTGCVLGRRTIALPVQTLTKPAATKGAIHIANVTDNRRFENKPSDPSTPSIDGDVTSLSIEQKNMMIGRQRNGYGKAMGDIALMPGDSVNQRVRLLVEHALEQRGYEISTDAATKTSASVSIDEFWAWFTPGMWTVTFESRVYCTLVLQRADKPATVVIKGYGTNHGQFAKDANWQLAYERAFKDFLEKSGPALEQVDF